VAAATAAVTAGAAAVAAAAAEPAPASPPRIAPLAVRAFGVACAAGVGQAALLDALREGRSALRANDFGAPRLATWIGRVDAVERTALPGTLRRWDSRATRLAWLGLQADGFADAARTAVARHGAARVGLALGTSASTIGVTEEAYRGLVDGAFPPALASPALNTPHAVAMFVREALGVEGPCVTVSTACSSSAKAFALAERWLRLGLVGAAVVGGVDALCGSLLFGFHALGLVSDAPCRPFEREREHERKGISLGEAAGFALLERGRGALELVGHGEASDAFHMSSPHPEGLGAERALDAALARSGLGTGAIDYLNLHGTASAKNDEVEAALVQRRYGPQVLASATKGLTGHTMGAAGIVEAAICLLALREGLVPGSANTTSSELLPALGLAPRAAALRTAASHSFGFGGSNAVLVFARGDA
jgi:3-oxoacyl-[acyl-carrier-protein] synthase-1